MFRIDDTYSSSRAPRPLTLSEAHERLNAILSDKVMRFNPYLVDDEALLECAERGHWLDFPSLTQMVVFHFHKIREVKSRFTYDTIDFNIGQKKETLSLPLGQITRPMAHHYSRCQI